MRKESSDKRMLIQRALTSLILCVSVIVAGCGAIGSDKAPDTLDLYETQIRMVGGVYVDANVEALKAECFSQSAGSGNIEVFEPKILNIHFEPDSYVKTPSTKFVNRHGHFKGKVMSREFSEAKTLLFWKHESWAVGHYTGTGATAFRTNLHACFVSKSSRESVRLTFSVSPPRSAKFSGAGDYHTRDEAYELVSDWINWKFAGGQEPQTDNRMSVRTWEPCISYETQYDDWLQRQEPSGTFEWSCSH